MAGGVKRVLGVVAAIAVPFLAPTIAGAIGVSSTLGTALVGAATGAAVASATGGDPRMGAIFGGLGTYGSQGGFNKLLGTTANTANAAGQTKAGLFGGATKPVAAAAATTAKQAVKQSFGAGLKTAAKGALANAAQSFTTPQGMARITLLAAMGGAGTTAEEQALIEQRKKELAQLAATDRSLFERQVLEAQKLLQQADQMAPDPAKAFAATKIAAERGAVDATRGLSAEEAARVQRRQHIAAAQAGATAAAAESVRGSTAQAQLRQAGLSALPTSAPEGYAGLVMPLYADLAKRRRQQNYDNTLLATKMFPSLFGFNDSTQPA